MGIATSEPPRPWSPFHLGLISYFCIIVPGGLLFAENYRRLGFPARKRPFQVISIGWFLLFMVSAATLPGHYYWVTELLHLLFPVGMILLQNPIYQKWREATDDAVPLASLQRPLLLSVLFALLLFAGIAGRDWYLQHRLEQEMQFAHDAYLSGNYDDALKRLHELEQEYPGERLVYINIALAFEGAGKRDSAIFYLQRWLRKHPDDAETQELLYNLRYGGEK
jgi:hypothetical protein